jgi:hypothetical protein
MPYDFSARGYLERARANLQKDDRQYLFYAAFELRCGVESRMQEYLCAWPHIPEKQKADWEIGKLGKAVEKHFILRDQYQEWSVVDQQTGQIRAVLYYTPVTKLLRINAGKLGNYLHSPSFDGDRSVWWADFRLLLAEMANQLETAVTGTLLGPAMHSSGLTNINLISEVVGDFDVNKIGPVGEKMTVKIDYLDALPTMLPENAIVWRPERQTSQGGADGKERGVTDAGRKAGS